MDEVKRLEAAMDESRELIREAHGVTKDLRAAVRDARAELRSLVTDGVASRIEAEVTQQLDELAQQTAQAIDDATKKVISEFDAFGETLLGKQSYWEKVSGRRSAKRPDPHVVTLNVGQGDAASP